MQTEAPQRRAVFLDRDGVINHDDGYTHKIDGFRFIDGIFDFARVAQDLGLSLIVVTNQAGIAHGFYSEEDFHSLTRWIERKFTEERAPLTATYYCPDHPEGRPPYRRNSEMRKPAAGMLYAAARDHGIDLSRSVIVGDREKDAVAGRTAGLAATVLFGTESLPADSVADIAIPDHYQLARWLTAKFGL